MKVIPNVKKKKKKTFGANLQRHYLSGQAPTESNVQTKKTQAPKERSSSCSQRPTPEASMRDTQEVPHTFVQLLETKVLPERHLATDTEKRPHGLKYHKLRK